MTNRLIEMVRHLGLDTDPLVRDELAGIIAANRVAGYTNQRAMDKIKQGQLPGPELSIAKLALTTNMRRMAEFVARVLGPRIIADTGEWGTYAWGAFLLGAPGMRIAGGSDEVMRNIVGERVLGLPKDPGIDSVSAFKDLKVGTQKT
jgi:acyl-CoA dehydrogenase